MSKPKTLREVVALAGLLDQLSRSLHSLGYSEHLFPAQWTALRYFARAEPQHATATALARYQGIAIGPVTRTVRTLLSKGLLQSVQMRGPGGPKRLDLTEAGLKLLERDPLARVVEACAELTLDERHSFADSLGLLLARLQTHGLW